jgi:ribosomal-protein-alanine N-acetyltransferase
MQTWNCARLGVGDLTEVMDLERLCFRTHWTREQFLLGLERGAFHILGIRINGALLAYLAFSVIAGEMEVMNIATHQDHRRKGFAARLLGKALEIARMKRAQQAFLEVRRSNLGAIDLYQKFGFIQVGTRKHYYPDNNEDALLFRLDFPPPECGASEEL